MIVYYLACIITNDYLQFGDRVLYKMFKLCGCQNGLFLCRRMSNYQALQELAM